MRSMDRPRAARKPYRRREPPINDPHNPRDTPRGFQPFFIGPTFGPLARSAGPASSSAWVKKTGKITTVRSREKRRAGGQGVEFPSEGENPPLSDVGCPEPIKHRTHSRLDTHGPSTR